MTIYDAARQALEVLEKRNRISGYPNYEPIIASLREGLLQEADNFSKLRTTHGEGCWSWGPAHYMCCYNELKKVQSK